MAIVLGTMWSVLLLGYAVLAVFSDDRGSQLGGPLGALLSFYLLVGSYTGYLLR